DLTRLLVDEADGHRERRLVGQVLLAALLDRELGLTEAVLAELDGERAGVVLDRRDVVDGLPQALVQEPVERRPLDVDQVRKLEDLLYAGEGCARARRGNLGGQQIQPPLKRRRIRNLGQANTAERQRDLQGYLIIRCHRKAEPTAAAFLGNPSAAAAKRVARAL